MYVGGRPEPHIMPLGYSSFLVAEVKVSIFTCINMIISDQTNNAQNSV